MKKITKSIAALLISFGIMLSSHGQKPSPELLNPENHLLVLIDFEGQMAFATKNISRRVSEARFLGIGI